MEDDTLYLVCIGIERNDRSYARYLKQPQADKTWTSRRFDATAERNVSINWWKALIMQTMYIGQWGRVGERGQK